MNAINVLLLGIIGRNEKHLFAYISSRPVNFILLEDRVTIPVQDLTDAQPKEYGDAWTVQFIEHARNRRWNIKRQSSQIIAARKQIDRHS